MPDDSQPQPTFRQRVWRLDLPMPLANFLFRAKGRGGHGEALEVWETAVKLMACATWAACRAQRVRSEGLVEACKPLGRPSFGHWAGLLREAAALLTQADGPIPARMRPLLDGLQTHRSQWPPALGELLTGLEEAARVQMQGKRLIDLFSAMVTYRNRTHGHAESVSRDLLEANATRLLDGVMALAELCPPIGSYRAVAVREVIRQGVGFSANLHLLHGSHGEPLDRPIRLGLERELEPGRAYLWHGPTDQPDEDLYLPLWPIAAAVADEKSGTWGLALLKDRARGPELRYLGLSHETINLEVDPHSYELLLGRRETDGGPTLPEEALAMDPWRGLQPYHEAHRALFFGRDRESAEVLSLLEDQGVVVVCGASGSGKSSLVRAGVVPALRQRAEQEDLTFSAVILRPGQHPVDALRTALRSVDLSSATASAQWAALVDRWLNVDPEAVDPAALANLLHGLRQQARAVVLVVDQFEEAATAGAPPPEAQCFLRLVATLAGRAREQATPVLCTLRADLLDRLLGQAESLDVLREYLYLLGPLQDQQLGAVVEGPLRGRHVEAEGGLAEQIAADVGDEPGSLALLSQVLTVLWDRRGDYGDRLTKRGYEDAGGVQGAVAKLGDEARAEVPTEQAAAFDKLLLSLATVGQRGAFVRTRMSLSALAESVGLDEPALRQLMEPLIRRRLVVLNTATQDDDPRQETAEIAHEALLRSWPYYRQLLADQREVVQLRADLQRDAATWDAAGRGRRELWTDGTSRLRRAEELRDAGRLPLTALQRRFLAAGRTKARNRRRVAIGAVAIMALLAVVAGAFWLRAEDNERLAFKKAEEAKTERDRAIAKAREARLANYASKITLADAAILRNDVFTARRALLRAHADLRGWEWRHLWYNSDISLFTLRGHERRVTCVAFSPDGKRIVSGSGDETVKVWDAERGRVLVVFSGHGSSVTSVAFSPDGKRIVSGSDDDTLRVWDFEGRRALLTLPGHGAGVSSVAFSPDGKRIVSGSGDRTLKVWDAESGRELLALRGHKGGVTSVAFNSDGKRIVSGSDDDTLKVWDLERGRELLTLRGHGAGVSSVAFSPDGKRIVSGSGDRTLKVWDAESGRELLALRGHKGGVTSVAFNSDGKRIVSGSDDDTLKVWDLERGRELLTLRGHAAGVSSVAFSPDGKRIVSGSRDRTLQVWNDEVRSGVLTLSGHDRPVYSIAFSSDGKRIVSGSLDKTLKVWDAEHGRELLTIEDSPIFSVAFSPDGTRIVSGNHDGTLKVWDAKSGRKLRTLLGHDGRIFAVAFSPDGKRIVSGSSDETVKVWDAMSGSELLTLDGHRDVVRCVAFSPDGKRIVSGGGDKMVKVWDARSGGESLTLRGHGDNVVAAAFSPDGKRIVSGSWDETLKVWDAESGRELRTLDGHWGAVTSVAFNKDGKRIVSGSEDNTLRVWDAESGHELLTLRGYGGNVSSVGFSPDRKRIVSGNEDGTLKVWTAVDVDEVSAQLEQSGGKE